MFIISDIILYKLLITSKNNFGVIWFFPRSYIVW